MFIDVNRYRYRGERKKKKKWVIPLVVISAGLFVFAAWRLHLPDRWRALFQKTPAASSLSQLWNNRQYEAIIARCDEVLSGSPLDYSVLVYRGFSYFYRAVSEVSMEDRVPFLDETVVSLRRALLVENGQWEPEINYILGKAYFHKGKYYFDLTVKYLARALDLGFKAEDIYDYLGLAYTQLGLVQEGLAYFLKALDSNPSDILLLTVGQSYAQLKQNREAEEYLIRTVNKTDDPAVEKKARSLLGQLYFEKQDYFKAEKEYLKIIALDAQSADAHFYLGEIYQKLNDPIKARAEWRKTLQIDPSHYGAKLRYYK